MADHSRRAIPPQEPRVNTLIAKSRREHALHSRSQRHGSSPTPLLSTLTLGHQLRVYPRIRVAGPPPPRSWAYANTSTSATSDITSGATPDAQWRAHAMRWIFLHLDQTGLIPHSVLHVDEGQSGPGTFLVPTLREMCVRTLVASIQIADTETQPMIREGVLEGLPTHLRRFIARYSAIHSPLPWITLAQLWGIEYGEQGADGEVILVGRDAGGLTFAGSAIKDILAPPALEPDTQSEGDEGDLAWDDEEYASPPPLKAFICIAYPITKYLTSFPPTITHLALVAIPLDREVTPRIVMSRLSNGLRLLEALDLSCNPWLVPDAINAVDWSIRWLRLRFAAFINCRNLGGFENITNVINGKRNWERVVHIDWA